MTDDDHRCDPNCTHPDEPQPGELTTAEQQRPLLADAIAAWPGWNTTLVRDARELADWLVGCGVRRVVPVEAPWRWLASTKELQERSFGQTFPKIGDALADYVSMNALAAHVELDEALGEVGWKPWAIKRGWINREAFLTELIDAGHLIANMLVAAGVTDEEYETAYRAKQQVNRDRMESGTYDGVSNKCPACKRAYTRVDGQIARKLTDAGCHVTPDGDWNCPMKRRYGADEKLAYETTEGR